MTYSAISQKRLRILAEKSHTFLVFSVFPAPDSPVMSIDWFSWFWSMLRYASSDTANRWGGISVLKFEHHYISAVFLPYTFSCPCTSWQQSRYRWGDACRGWWRRRTDRNRSTISIFFSLIFFIDLSICTVILLFIFSSSNSWKAYGWISEIPE